MNILLQEPDMVEAEDSAREGTNSCIHLHHWPLCDPRGCLSPHQLQAVPGAW